MKKSAKIVICLLIAFIVGSYLFYASTQALYHNQENFAESITLKNSAGLYQKIPKTYINIIRFQPLGTIANYYQDNYVQKLKITRQLWWGDSYEISYYWEDNLYVIEINDCILFIKNNKYVYQKCSDILLIRISYEKYGPQIDRAINKLKNFKKNYEELIFQLQAKLKESQLIIC